MEGQSNVAASISLTSAVGVVVLFSMTFCAGFVPGGFMCGYVLTPLGWLLAFVAFVSGILGWRAAGVMEDRGKGAAMAGIAVSVVYGLLQALLMVLAAIAWLIG